ncbi:hypothetical protein C2S53_017891 [Perilla frutescens var. hirtella]|uniref:Pentatricopeptide repeat-containing protein n=1 Tax=Perilla frutescens var. hirtella TaxID=608512 RepID=A0AAD4IM51_PERFH|nr:hypothetical protein C2S53_017891 [Perilla frutescens var. hirtella]
MKKIARFRYFHEENIIHADHQPPPNDLQVVSCGRRRITLPSIQESHHDHGRQTLLTETILDDLVYNPTPLRWYRPPEADFNGVEDHQKKRRSKRSKNEDDEDQRPLIPIEKIEGLFQAIQSRNGSRPVFLYRKKLEDSDVKRNLNRLFVTRRERLMGNFARASVKRPPSPCGTILIVDRYSFSGVAFSSAKGLDVERCKVVFCILICFGRLRVFWNSLHLKNGIYFCRLQSDGAGVHGYSLKSGLGNDPFIQNALINMYSKCGSFEDSLRVFNEMMMKDCISWSCVINAYGLHGCAGEALQLFN